MQGRRWGLGRGNVVRRRQPGFSCVVFACAGSALIPVSPGPSCPFPRRYPENLTLGNLMYFLALPTLTYQVG